MGLNLIFIGLLFFFNPNLGLFDFLPDSLGLIFIINGLSKLRDIDDRFSEARVVAIRLLVTQIVKIFLWVYTFVFAKDTSLPFTFIYSVAEAILLIWFFTRIYRGIEYVCTRHGGEKHLLNFQTSFIFTHIFVVAKSVLTFIPESLSLWNKYSEEGRIIEEPFKMVKPYIILLCFVGVFALGICFICITKKYLISLHKDKQLNAELLKIYNTELSNNPKLIIKRVFHKSVSLIIAGCVFLFDFPLDGINILPNIFAYVFISAGIYFLQNYTNSKKTPVISVLLIVISALSYVFKTLINISFNHASSAESFFSRKFVFVENGSGIYMGTFISLFEALLYILLVFIMVKALTNYGNSLKNKCHFKQEALLLKTVSIAMAPVYTVVYTLPAVTAYFHYKSRNYLKTETYDIILEKINICENTGDFGKTLLVIFIIITLYSILRIKKRIDFEL